MSYAETTRISQAAQSERVTMEFDHKTCEEMKYYVYALIDPRDNKPFYVGKGKENRVFAHVDEALETSNETDKLDLIRGIKDEGYKVDQVILRHGLDENTAFIIEASLLDFASYFKFDLTNLVLGHHSSVFGAMKVEEIIRKYNAPPLDELGDDCVIININRRYRETRNDVSIYDVTKGHWAMSNPITRGIKYVLAEYKSFIVEVFEVEIWEPVETGTRIRWEFTGKIAPDEIKSKYLNRKIHKSRGAANPISYHLQKPSDDKKTAQ